MRPTAVVIGVGAEQGLGAALCQKFSMSGHHVVVAGRTHTKVHQVAKRLRASGGSADEFAVDTTIESQVQQLFDHCMNPGAGLAPVDLVVFNAGNNRPIPFRALSAEDFESHWRVGCFGGFLVGREAARRLVPLGRGSIFFTGASGSLRGKAEYGHFAAAKAGLRMLSQSMAREFGPLGLHVAHVVIDGGIAGDRLLSKLPHLSEQRGADGLLDIHAIAENYWHLHKQPKSAWTQELDLRPFKEPF